VVNIASTETVASKIISTLSQPFTLDKITVKIGVSIGIALSDADNPVFAKELVRNADHAMYAAKLSGKGKYKTYSQALEEIIVS
jgi:GGDEF domain-containing protein